MNPTQWFLVAVGIMLIVWDTYAASRWGYQGTISYDLLTDAEKRPIIAFAMGVVAGHLFWPQ